MRERGPGTERAGARCDGTKCTARGVGGTKRTARATGGTAGPGADGSEPRHAAMRRAAEAARRLWEEWTADWRVPYTPPPGLHPGLGIPQVFPGIGRGDPLLAALVDVAGMVAARVAARAGESAARQTAAAGLSAARMAQLARLLPPDTADAGRARAVRLAQERRKVCRRSTAARRPTPEDVRAAWAAARSGPGGRLRLGRLLMDLECFVDNDLVVRWYRKLPRIVGRKPGIRGWIAENCPELVPKYKTLMRHKALATKARQEAGATDPVPLGGPVAGTVPAAGTPVRIQFRRRGTGLPRRFRFAWERGALRVDANGRFFLTNENYSRAVRSLDGVADVSEEPGTPAGYNSRGDGRRRRHGKARPEK